MNSMKMKQLIAAGLALLLVLSDEIPLYAAQEQSTTQEESAQPDSTDTRTMQLGAKVAATGASYYVDVPADIAFGTLSGGSDMIKDYEIAVEADQLTQQETVTVSSEEAITLTGESTDYALPCYNSFATRTFKKSGSADGTLTIYQKDLARSAKGSYHGTLHFAITYKRSAQTDNTDNENNNGSITYGSVKINKSGITDAAVSGLSAYASAYKEGAYEFSIKPADATEDKDGIAAIASLISAGAEDGTTQYYDFSLLCKKWDDESQSVLSEEIDNTGKHVLEIRIPISASNAAGAAGYRHHNGTVSLMQKLSSRPTSNYVDNTYYCDLTNGYFYFYTSRFSVFAIHKSAATASTTTTDASTSSILDVTTETKFTASVSLRKSTDFASTSMCNPLFYKEADMLVNGDTTKLTLYVIDPIPNYSSEGTPLSSVSFSYNGTTYAASIDSANKVIKSYSAASGFISEAGNYNSSLITVSLPTAAIKTSADGKLTCSAYVNAVMKSTQSFYVVLSDFEKGETTSAATATAITTTAKTKTSANSLQQSDGLYQLPVTAIKEKSDDASMMADYMYSLADLEIASGTYKLTLYIQHTVAGIEAGGPKYMKYEDSEALKVDNAATINGIVYDSFTLTLTDTIPNPMTVTMYINAMSIEVKARLVFSLDQLTKKTESTETPTAQTTDTKTAKAAGTSSAAKASAKGSAAKTSAAKEESEADMTEIAAEDKVPASASPAQSEADTQADAAALPQTEGYLLVTNALWQAWLYLGLTLLIVGVAGYLIYRRKANQL